MHRLFLLLGAALLARLATPAHDQDIGPVIDMSIIATNAGLQTVEMAERKRAGLPAKYVGKSSVNPVVATRTSFAYVPTASAAQQALARQTKNQPLPTAQHFAATFGPGGSADYQVLYRKVLASSGLRDNDVADAYAALMVAGYQVTHGVSGTLLPAGPASAVRAQLAPAVGRVLATKSAATAATLGEYLKLQTALLYLGSQKSTPDFLANVGRIFRQRFHLDVAAVTLTSNGFTKK